LWPQLASSVALGGALAADIARRILLGEHHESGRYYVDLETIVRDGAGELREGAAPPGSVEVAQEAQRSPALPPVPAPHTVDAEAIRWLVAHATLAPSAHNAQPWRFVFHDGVLSCVHDPSHDLPMLDFEHGATWVAFGAMLENLESAARAIGLVADVETFPEPSDDLVARARFRPGTAVRDPLFDWIALRVTNRRHDLPADAAGLPEGVEAKLHASIGGAARLTLLSSRRELDAIGALIGSCDRLTALNRSIHEETMPGFRWTHADVEAHRDGLDVTTLELSAADRAGLELLSHWPTVEALARLGGGRALESGAHKAVRAARAVGLLTRRGMDRSDYLEGGRAMQRLWLNAAASGVALQPMTSLPYLFARLERGSGRGLSAAECDTLAGLRRPYRQLFDLAHGTAEVLLFRLHLAAPPTARSLRRRVEDVLTLV
jgi:nitroreductase